MSAGRGEARAIGELIKPILERAEAMRGFQLMLEALPSADARKTFITTARDVGAIDDLDTRLLIETYQLETA